MLSYQTGRENICQYFNGIIAFASLILRIEMKGMVTAMDVQIKDILKNKFVILLLLTGAVYFFLKIIAPLVAPLLLAMLFVTIFGPLLKKMQQIFLIHRQIGAGILLTFGMVVFLFVVWILLYWMVGSLPGWFGQAGTVIEELGGQLEEFCNSAGNKLGFNSINLEKTLLLYMRQGINDFEVDFMPKVLSQSIEYARVLGKAGAFAAVFFIGTILLAKDYDNIMNWMLEREECFLILEVICGVIRYVASFVRTQVIIMTVIALLAGTGLMVGGVPHGFLWGILTGALDALPFVGTGIVLVPLSIYYLIGRKIKVTIICLVLYVACALARQFLEPKLIGRKMGIPPIAVLIAIYAGVALFGISGIIKGPLGYVLISQTYKSICKRMESKGND